MSLEKKVRKTIKKELQTVNSSNAPRVFEAIQTDLGYKNIEDRIINMMIDNNRLTVRLIIEASQPLCIRKCENIRS